MSLNTLAAAGALYTLLKAAPTRNDKVANVHDKTAAKAANGAATAPWRRSQRHGAATRRVATKTTVTATIKRERSLPRVGGRVVDPDPQEAGGGTGWLGFKEAREVARGLGVKTRAEWDALVMQKKIPGTLPTMPHRMYAGLGWESYSDWLGVEESDHSNWLPFHQARAFIRGLGLKNKRAWNKWTRRTARQDCGIPPQPEVVYGGKGWKGFDDWLGFEGTEALRTSAAKKRKQGQAQGVFEGPQAKLARIQRAIAEFSAAAASSASAGRGSLNAMEYMQLENSVSPKFAHEDAELAAPATMATTVQTATTLLPTTTAGRTENRDKKKSVEDMEMQLQLWCQKQRQLRETKLHFHVQPQPQQQVQQRRQREGRNEEREGEN